MYILTCTHCYGHWTIRPSDESWGDFVLFIEIQSSFALSVSFSRVIKQLGKMTNLEHTEPTTLCYWCWNKAKTQTEMTLAYNSRCIYLQLSHCIWLPEIRQSSKRSFLSPPDLPACMLTLIPVCIAKHNPILSSKYRWLNDTRHMHKHFPLNKCCGFITHAHMHRVAFYWVPSRWILYTFPCNEIISMSSCTA